MPIYEYEPNDHECLICSGRFEALQGIEDPDLEFCPTCGLPVHRVISAATFKLSVDNSPDRAARKGLSTFRKVEEGKWEKVSGPGVDMIVGVPEDVASVKEEKKPKKIDLTDS